MGRLVWQWADGGSSMEDVGTLPQVGNTPAPGYRTYVPLSSVRSRARADARLNFSGVSAKVRPQAYEMAIHAAGGSLLTTGRLLWYMNTGTLALCSTLHQSARLDIPPDATQRERERSSLSRWNWPFICTVVPEHPSTWNRLFIIERAVSS